MNTIGLSNNGAHRAAVRTRPPGGALTVAGAGLAAALCLCNTWSSVAATFSNATKIMINDWSSATPYPSSIQVQGLSGTVTNLTVTIYGFSHTWPSDVCVLLARPSGQSVLLMDHVGSSFTVRGLNLAFDDSAPSRLPVYSAVVSGVYQPTQNGSGPTFPWPAPNGTYGTTLSVLNQLDPNTEWNLFVLDATAGNSGSISGGWSITFATASELHILSQPQSRTAEIGSAVEFRVRTEADPPAGYQRFFNGANAIGGGTNSLLQFNNVASTQAGAYTVVVTNIAQVLTSNPAMLSVISPIPRRRVPAINLTGEVGSFLHLSYANTPGHGADWQELDAVTMTAPQQFYPDLTLPGPSARFYRAWQTNVLSVPPALEMIQATELTLTGAIGGKLRIDRISQFGPIDAWVTLDTVTLTNTTQPYFDFTMFHQPARLYRVVQVP